MKNREFIFIRMPTISDLQKHINKLNENIKRLQSLVEDVEDSNFEEWWEE